MLRLQLLLRSLEPVMTWATTLEKEKEMAKSGKLTFVTLIVSDAGEETANFEVLR